MIETEKQYRLPKWFADKWLEALESGEYKQAKEALKRNLYGPVGIGYCCIGVAGLVCGIHSHNLYGDYLNSNNTKGYRVPKELMWEHNNHNDLSNMLSFLNDDEGFTFHQIAQWVRDNVEIYEEEESGT